MHLSEKSCQNSRSLRQPLFIRGLPGEVICTGNSQCLHRLKLLTTPSQSLSSPKGSARRSLGKGGTLYAAGLQQACPPLPLATASALWRLCSKGYCKFPSGMTRYCEVPIVKYLLRSTNCSFKCLKLFNTTFPVTIY